jgi:hypothetical protein
MKKTMTMAAIALAVSAMAGSAYAASETAPTMAQPVAGMQEKASVTKVINLEELAKKKGITVEELVKQLEKEGKIIKATAVPVTSAQN